VVNGVITLRDILRCGLFSKFLYEDRKVEVYYILKNKKFCLNYSVN
jgi:hypothetical protein